MRKIDQSLRLIVSLMAWLLRGKPASYYVLGSALLIIAIFTLQTGKLTLIRFLIISTLVGGGAHLYLQGNKLEQSASEGQDISLEEEMTMSNDRTVYTDGGNYTESVYGNYIQGDYVEVQGYHININQDLSEVAVQLKEILNHLQDQGNSAKEAETQVSTDLAEQAHDNPKFKTRLFQWREIIGVASDQSDETSAAEDVVRYVFSLPNNRLNDPVLVVGGRYKKLYELLRSKRWEEADAETAKLIFALVGKEMKEYSWLEARDIEILPGKELNTINKLWVQCSNGRFGFSVQKRIWQEGNCGYGGCNSFGDRVGWRVENSWIYYADLTYSLGAPPGHFPVTVMLSSLAYGSTSCQPDFSILRTLMQRLYKL